jgi:hypothetical protein
LRQFVLLQSFNIIIEDILRVADARSNRNSEEKSDNAASTALAKLSLQHQTLEVTLRDVAAAACNQTASLEDYLSLLSTEPVALAHAVNIWLFSRQELVADEKGRSLPVHTDKYISAAVSTQSIARLKELPSGSTLATSSISWNVRPPIEVAVPLFDKKYLASVILNTVTLKPS